MEKDGSEVPFLPVWQLGMFGHSEGSWLQKAEPGWDVTVQRDASAWCLLLGWDFGVNVSKSSDPWILKALGNTWDVGRVCVWPDLPGGAACWHGFPWTTVWLCLLTSGPCELSPWGLALGSTVSVLGLRDHCPLRSQWELPLPPGSEPAQFTEGRSGSPKIMKMKVVMEEALLF